MDALCRLAKSIGFYFLAVQKTKSCAFVSLRKRMALHPDKSRQLRNG